MPHRVQVFNASPSICSVLVMWPALAWRRRRSPFTHCFRLSVLADNAVTR